MKNVLIIFLSLCSFLLSGQNQSEDQALPHNEIQKAMEEMFEALDSDSLFTSIRIDTVFSSIDFNEFDIMGMPIDSFIRFDALGNNFQEIFDLGLSQMQQLDSEEMQELLDQSFQFLNQIDPKELEEMMESFDFEGIFEGMEDMDIGIDRPSKESKENKLKRI